MLVVLADGPKKGDFYTLPNGTESGVFPVILTEYHLLLLKSSLPLNHPEKEGHSFTKFSPSWH